MPKWGKKNPRWGKIQCGVLLCRVGVNEIRNGVTSLRKWGKKFPGGVNSNAGCCCVGLG